MSFVVQSSRERGGGSDACHVPTNGPKVTPVLDPPKAATRSTESAALVVWNVSIDAGPEAESDPSSWLDSAFWAEGIDYDRWSSVAQPSARSAFADRLDVVDLLGD
jgi:hypothetical protein